MVTLQWFNWKQFTPLVHFFATINSHANCRCVECHPEIVSIQMCVPLQSALHPMDTWTQRMLMDTICTWSISLDMEVNNGRTPHPSPLGAFVHHFDWHETRARVQRPGKVSESDRKDQTYFCASRSAIGNWQTALLKKLPRRDTRQVTAAIKAQTKTKAATTRTSCWTSQLEVW